jgi:hypothetical protein
MGTVVLAGATSGSTTLTPVDAVTATITLPSATCTLAALGANTFTGLQTITGNCTVSGILGTGSASATGLNNGDITLTGSAGLKATYSGSSFELIHFDLQYRIELGVNADRLPAVPRVTTGNINGGQAPFDGCLLVDSTNNRLVYYSGGARYYIAGTAF